MKPNENRINIDNDTQKVVLWFILPFVFKAFAFANINSKKSCIIPKGQMNEQYILPNINKSTAFKMRKIINKVIEFMINPTKVGNNWREKKVSYTILSKVK